MAEASHIAPGNGTKSVRPSDHSSGDPIADRRADYASGYAEGGDHAAAAELMRQALELAPGWAAGWSILAAYRASAGDGGAAMDALRRAASLDPEDALGARARLAALGEGTMPGTLPPAFVRGLFDQYADRFERQLRDRLAYRAPELLLEAIENMGGTGRAFGAVLDLGCGTGLMGGLLKPRTGRLEGLDLSPRMLAKAQAKGIYDALHEADILRFEAQAASFDLVVAADVLNYVGDLGPVFARVAAWLRPGGLFAFTVEAHAGEEPFLLRDTMRYAHSQRSAARLLDAAGLGAILQRAVTLRQDRGRGVEGWVFVAGAQAPIGGV